MRTLSTGFPRLGRPEPPVKPSGEASPVCAPFGLPLPDPGVRPPPFPFTKIPLVA